MKKKFFFQDRLNRIKNSDREMKFDEHVVNNQHLIDQLKKSQVFVF